MPDPNNPAQPPEKPTMVDLKAPPPWAIELTQRVASGFATSEAKYTELAEHLDKQDETLRTLANSDVSASQRMQKFEMRLDAFEEQRRNTSIKVTRVSDSDLAQEAKLAEFIVWRNGVEDKLWQTATKDDLKTTTLAQTTQLFARFDELKKKPIVRYAIAIATGALVSWAASHGVHLQ